jgi:hypothetical protein
MKNYVFIFLIFVSTTLFSQMNLGVGIGQQYGWPQGVRLGYTMKVIEPSVNLGLTQTPYKRAIVFGAGLSVYYHSQFMGNWRKKISYNFDAFNNTPNGLLTIHSLLLNLEYNVRLITPIQIRYGLGARYSSIGRFQPTFSVGLFVDFDDIKNLGFHFHFRNKLGKG